MTKKIKGIQKSVVKQDIKLDDYKACLNGETKRVDMNMIRSNKHLITTQTINKLALCAINDKRYMLDANNSYAYGHYLIK